MHTRPTPKQFLDLERRYWKAIQTGDVATARKLTDFPHVINSSSGFGSIDEKTFVQMMNDRSYSIDRFELSDEATLRFLNDDVAVLAYDVHEEVTVNGQPLELDATESSTWVRRDGHWARAQHSEALAGDPFGRDKLEAQAAQTEADAETTSRDEREIRDTIGDWLKAAEAHDVATMLGMMTDDVVFQVPGIAPFGKDAFATYHGGARANRIKTESAQIEELEVRGDWAWCRTHLVMEVTPPGEPSSRRAGHTLSIFRKSPEGRWQLARDANTQIELEG
jgi:uncharacterized protein (TIGR02246 family)